MALLFFPFSPFHGFGWCDYNFVSASGANVGFATCAGETVAARFGKQGFAPRSSAMGAGDDDWIVRWHFHWILNPMRISF